MQPKVLLCFYGIVELNNAVMGIGNTFHNRILDGDEFPAVNGPFLTPIEDIPMAEVAQALEYGADLVEGWEFDLPNPMHLNGHNCTYFATRGRGYTLDMDAAKVLEAAADGVKDGCIQYD